VIIFSIYYDEKSIKKIYFLLFLYNLLNFKDNLNVEDKHIQSIIEKDIKNFQEITIYNSFSNIINYITNTEATNLIKYSNAKGFFFLVCNKNNKKLIEEFNLIARKFYFLKEKIWFLYSYEEEEKEEEDLLKNDNIENSKNIKLFFYDNFDLIGKSTYFFFNEDINYNYIINFFKKKVNFDNLINIIDSKNKLLDIFEYKSDISFTKYFVLFFFNLKNIDENKSFYKKWIYLLEKSNYLINSESFTKIQFFKYDFSRNKEIINFPKDLLSFDDVNENSSSSKIYLYEKKSNQKDIHYEYKKYDKGPSLQFFEKFLKENIRLISIQFNPEEYQKYFEEIFYNNELMELEDDLDEIDNEINFDESIIKNENKEKITDVNQILNEGNINNNYNINRLFTNDL